MSIEDLIREKYAAQVEASRLSGAEAARIGQPAHNTVAQASLMHAQTDRANLPIQQQLANTGQFNAATQRQRALAENALDFSKSNAVDRATEWDYPRYRSGSSDTSLSTSFGAGGLFDPTARIGPYTEKKVRPYKRGTTRVPGKGSGKIDTVDAKLAPGEAVLNKAAAEMAGRDKIAKLNAAGARKMGLGMYGRDENRFASGTAQVPDDWRIGPMDGSTGRGGGSDYPATMSRGDPPVPMMMTPPADVPAIEYGITMPGQGGASGNGSPYIWGVERGQTPRYAAGTEYVGSMQVDFDKPVKLSRPRQSVDDSASLEINFGAPSGPGMRPATPLDQRASDLYAQHFRQPPAPQRLAGQRDAGAIENSWRRAPSAPPASMLAPAPMSQVGWMDPNARGTGQEPPMIAPQQGLGMMPRSLGSERARQGLSGFERAFAAARKAAGGGSGMFNYKGKSYNTKIAGER